MQQRSAKPSMEAKSAQSPAADKQSRASPASDAGTASRESAVQELTGERSLESVRYTFRLNDNTDTRWLVASSGLVEGISEPYSLTLELSSVQQDDPEALLGASCTLLLERSDAQRHIHGIIGRVSRLHAAADATHAMVTIVPALSALAHRTDTRVFGGGTESAVTVPEVLEKVLKNALEPYERAVQLKLTRAIYPKREYITQYRETDLRFVQRLMAEEGIWYYFDHESDPKKEVLVLVDSNESAPEPKLGAGGNELPLQLGARGLGNWQEVTRFSRKRALGGTGVAIRKYNWTNPERERTPKKSLPEDSEDASALGPRAKYFPYDITLWDYSSSEKTFRKSDADDQARMRWEHEQLQHARVSGAGNNLVALHPGQKVRVKGHPEGLDGEWLVVAVSTSGQDGSSEYPSHFECVPHALAFRPHRIEKPIISGIQTAVVVGPDGKPSTAGDDIHTDEHGRVQVKFHWDRTEPGKPDATRTCFLRVAQLWGGAGWGAMFIPRIGMEVVVSFVGGDPDKPLITGCVYNGLNKPIHELPKEKTKSYIRTSSSPGGEGYNELCFEDKKGQEEIYLHAQRDQREEVEHNHEKHVKADRQVKVGGNESYAVEGTQLVTVTKKRTVEAKDDEQYKVTKNQLYEVGEKTTELYHGGRERTVEKFDNTTVKDANKNTTVKGQYNVQVSTHFSVKHGDANQLLVNDALWGSFQDKVELKVGGNRVLMDGDKITLSATQELVLQCGAASLTLKKDGTIEASGTKKVSLTAGPSTLSAEPQGVTVSAPKITSSAIGIHEITGVLIKVG